MRDLQPNYWLAEQAGARWLVQSRPRHPFAAGALCVALAVGAWYGLLSRFGQTTEVGATVPGHGVPAQAADTQPRRETRQVDIPPRTPSASPPSAQTAPRGSSKTSMPKVLSDRASRILSASAPQASGDSEPKALSALAPKASSDSTFKASSDSAPRSKLSPFRRSHPWAASSGGRYYYPSSCPSTLLLPDLVFFRSETEARKRGFISSGRPACE